MEREAPAAPRHPVPAAARRPTVAVAALLAAAVGAFSGVWAGGALVIDGPGSSLYLRLALDYLGDLGRVPYWLPLMWSGAPVWALGPSFPVLLLVPVAAVVGPDAAVKAGILGFQVAGGVGAYVLARSLWGARAAPLVAGLVYALHPMIVSHGALFGGETILGVTAAAPWLAWSLRLGLRGSGRRYLAGAGLLAAFAVLHQAEYALGLVLLCLSMLAVEMSRARSGGVVGEARRVAVRAAGVVLVGLGAIAHWLLPFVALGRSFVLSPPELVEGELAAGFASRLSRDLGQFLHRPPTLSGVVSFHRADLLPQSFYMGWVCVGLTVVTVVLLARRRGDDHLSAILLASAFGVWLSTGAVPLASSGPALRHQVVPLALAGAVAGLLLGGFLRRLDLGRALPVALAGAAALVATGAYLTPYLTLQGAVPLLANIRFPRFYLLSTLGLALGTAYPLLRAEQWLRARSPGGGGSSAQARALAVAVAGAFVFDALPAAGHYRVRPPADQAAYQAVAPTLEAVGREARVASTTADPRALTGVLRAGAPESVGWPHPVAGRWMWRLSGETFAAPAAYREAALGLSATAVFATEVTAGTGTDAETIREVALSRNPRVLPLVRSYEQAVVVRDAELSPRLATSLAYRNVGVVTGGPAASRALPGMPVAVVGPADPCSSRQIARTGAVGGEVALACGVDAWIGNLFAGVELVPLGPGAGGVFGSLADGLRGVSVWLDRPPGRAELALHEVGAGSLALGPELARGQAVGTDEYGLSAFTFDPVPGAAGRRFAFVLTCPGCPEGAEPRMVAGTGRGRGGNLIVGDRLRTDRVVAFTPIHDRLPPATTPAARSRAERPGPGRWRVEVDGPNPSLLVVAEAWFPGWRARVDGRSVPVLQADGAFLGVPLAAGRHVVTLDYHRPAAAVAGRLVTGATLVALAVGWRRSRRARRPGRPARAGPRPDPPRPRPAPGADDRLPGAGGARRRDRGRLEVRPDGPRAPRGRPSGRGGPGGGPRGG